MSTAALFCAPAKRAHPFVFQPCMFLEIRAAVALAPLLLLLPGLVAPAKSAPVEETPLALSGAETFIYQNDPATLRLHVFKPQGWQPSDRRAAFVVFFGGNWTHGTPLQVAGWTRWAAAELGLVGVAPDYRTKRRFGTSPVAAVSDARRAVRWLQEHADELGIDPRRIVVAGDSVGGHLALWTALSATPPGDSSDRSPVYKPAALVLTSPVSDTSKKTGYTPERFGADADAMSPRHRLDPQMPPLMIFHGDADRIVPHAQSVRLRAAWRERGSICELITVPRGTHNFGSELAEWQGRIRTAIASFLRQQQLLPAGPR